MSARALPRLGGNPLFPFRKLLVLNILRAVYWALPRGPKSVKYGSNRHRLRDAPNPWKRGSFEQPGAALERISGAAGEPCRGPRGAVGVPDRFGREAPRREPARAARSAGNREVATRCGAGRTTVRFHRRCDRSGRSAGDIARSPDESLTDDGLAGCDLLALEDIQHLSASAADAACDLIDGRTQRRRATIVTASAGPSQLAHLPQRLRSRLAGGLVVRLEPLAVPSRRAILAEVAVQKGVRLTDDALDWLAEQATGGGVRATLGLLQNLALLAPNFPGPLARADVERALAESGQPTSAAPDVSRIVERVAEAFGISVKELLSASRLRGVLRSRQVAMFLARELTGLSLPRLGAAFGARPHHRSARLPQGGKRNGKRSGACAKGGGLACDAVKTCPPVWVSNPVENLARGWRAGSHKWRATGGVTNGSQPPESARHRTTTARHLRAVFPQGSSETEDRRFQRFRAVERRARQKPASPYYCYWMFKIRDNK